MKERLRVRVATVLQASVPEGAGRGRTADFADCGCVGEWGLGPVRGSAGRGGSSGRVQRSARGGEGGSVLRRSGVGAVQSVPLGVLGGLTTVLMGNSGDLTTVPLASLGGLTTVPMGNSGDLTTVPMGI